MRTDLAATKDLGMGGYLLQRLIHSIIVLILISLVTFGLIHAAPGGPGILLDPDLSPQAREQMARGLGLDDPLPVQYARWVVNAVQGDFGQSIMRKRPVREMIWDRVPATIELAVAGLAFAVVFGIPLGLLAAQRSNTIWDRSIVLVATMGIAIPGFWFAILLIILFSVELGWLPSSGRFTIGDASLMDRAKHIIMPGVVIGLYSMARLTYFTRSSMLEVLNADYIRTARTKGLSERVVMYGHALKNGLIPVITVLGVTIPQLIGGAVITETVFGWPGMGRLAADAAFQRDYPVIMGITMVISVIVIVTNLITDLAYSFVDPRIKLGE
jgi:peptide/nickel transport system permease protein